MKNTILIQDEVESFLRSKLEERLSKLAPNQLELFIKLYPDGIVSEDKLLSAIDVCDRTIRKNRDGVEEICQECRNRPVLRYINGHPLKMCEECAAEIVQSSDEYKRMVYATADKPPAYDPQYGDDIECTCGHPYHRHFDSYEDMAPVGCKYCGCVDFLAGNISDFVHMRREKYEWPICYGDHDGRNLKFTENPEEITCRGCKETYEQQQIIENKK